MIAIYARQSIEKKDSISIEGQIEKCIALCSMNAWDYEIYKDAGFSGKDLNRPDFNRVMQGVRSGKIDKVICYRLDRISRSIADFSQLLIEFDKYNAQFISVTENFDTSTPLGRAMINIVMTFAQLERETVVERVTDNYYYRASLGHWGGGPAPFGYNLKRCSDSSGKKYTTLEINESEAKYVRDMFRWYLEADGSVQKIIDKLNELKVPSRGSSAGNGGWTSRVVSEILWRPLYTYNDMTVYNYFKQLNANFVNDVSEFDGTKAVNLYGKLNKNSGKHKRSRKVEDQYFAISPHQALIDSDTWVKVQNKKALVRSAPPRKGTGRTSPFTGLMRCGCCGYSVSTNSDRTGSRYYICSTRKNRGSGLCSLNLIPAKNANPVILSLLVRHYKSGDINDIIQKASNPTVSAEYLVKKNDIEMQLVKVDSEIDNLISSIADGSSVVGKYIQKKIEQLDHHRAVLVSELKELEIAEYENKSRIDNIDELKRLITNMEQIIANDDFDEIKNMCQTLIKKITFTNDNIDVEFVL